MSGRQTIPLGSLQWGQFLSNASSPLYQLFMHSLHPNRVLQHLVAITGGQMGTFKQTLHLKASFTRLRTLSGKVVKLLTSVSSSNARFVSWTVSRVSAKSALRLPSFSEVSFPTFLFFNSGVDSSSESSLSKAFLPTLMAYIFRPCFCFEISQTICHKTCEICIFKSARFICKFPFSHQYSGEECINRWCSSDDGLDKNGPHCNARVGTAKYYRY